MKWKIETERMKIQVLPDLESLSRAAAEIFARLARDAAVENNHRFTVALAGGSAPKSLYQLLTNEREPFRRSVDWRKINFFWGDERCVPPDSDESNFRTANENLLQPLGISPMNFHRIEGELDAVIAARNYERFLRLYFNLPGEGVPRFDLILLGMGADGHTASLFPQTEVLGETEKLVAAPWVEKFGSRRVTVTPLVINNAAQVVFLVAGADKAETLRDVLEGDFQPEKYHSQIVRPVYGKLIWLVDEAAARLISPRTIAASVTNGS